MLKVAGGLFNLDAKKYKQAAKKFTETTTLLNNNIVAPQDVAVYGGLCALSSFDRQDLKKVIDNVSFRNFLELVPDMRELIEDFYSSRYASCLRILEKIKQSLLLDIFLHEHIELLYQKIRNKALVQYFSPFSSIDLNKMAAAFNTNVAGLEKELSKLIMEGQIQARIDSHNKRLYARLTDERSAIFEKTLLVGEEYQENIMTLLMRMNITTNDLIVRTSKQK